MDVATTNNCTKYHFPAQRQPEKASEDTMVYKKKRFLQVRILQEARRPEDEDSPDLEPTFTGYNDNDNISGCHVFSIILTWENYFYHVQLRPETDANF